MLSTAKTLCQATRSDSGLIALHGDNFTPEDADGWLDLANAKFDNELIGWGEFRSLWLVPEIQGPDRLIAADIDPPYRMPSQMEI